MSRRAPWRCSPRSPGWGGLLGALAGALLVVPGGPSFAGDPHPTPARADLGTVSGAGPSAAATGAAPTGGLTPSPLRSLAAVTETLARGAGPAAGRPLACTATGSGSAQCAPLPPGAAPTVAAPKWNNETADLLNASAPPAGEEAGLAFDGYDGYYVFFGGCLVTACPSGATWIYSDGSWANWTALVGTAPSARYAASMTYDPNFGAVLLFGGCTAGACPAQDTWSYRSQSWTNITSTAGGCAAHCPVAVWGASWAWDPTDAISVLYGGCTDRTCQAQTNQTAEEGGPSSGWTILGSGPEPPARAFGPMAFDPSEGALLLFGGGDTCAPFTLCVRNDSWWFDRTAGWHTVAAAGAVPARAAALLAWDAASGTMLLYGGDLGATGATNDSWSLACPGGACRWTERSPSAPAPARFGMAWSSNSSGLAPWFIGGVNGSSASQSDQWAWGSAPSSMSVAVDPDPTTLNYPTWFNATVVGGTAPYVVSWYWPAFHRSYPGLPEHTVFSAPAGTFTANATGVDAAGLLIRTSLSLGVTPAPNVALLAPGTADVGVGCPLSAQVANGTGLAPFVYRWNYSDGTNGSGASVVHLFSAVGTYAVSVALTDRAGHTARAEANLTVVDAPSVRPRVDRSPIDPGLAANLSANGSGGRPPYAFRWNFGDGAQGTGAAVRHAFLAPGSYPVSVELVDSAGGSANGSITVIVNPPLTATLATNASTPRAGVPIGFTAHVAGGEAPYTFRWEFGDGTPPLDGTASVDHSYARAGSYAIRVTIADALGVSTVGEGNLTVELPGGGGGAAPAPPSALLELVVVVAGVLAVGALGGRYLTRRPRRPSHRPRPDASVPAPEAPPGGPPAAPP
jgi:PKD domain